MNRTAILAATAVAHMTAFANAKGDAPAAPAAPSAPAAPAAAASNAITVSAAPMPLPARKTKRGSETKYPFAQLAAPVRDGEGNITAAASFHVADKTAKQMSTIVSNQNRKATKDKTDAAGNTVFKTQEITDAAGNKVVTPTTKPERVAERHYVAFDVDATDPAGKGVRVYRDL